MGSWETWKRFPAISGKVLAVVWGRQRRHAPLLWGGRCTVKKGTRLCPAWLSGWARTHGFQLAHWARDS